VIGVESVYDMYKYLGRVSTADIQCLNCALRCSSGERPPRCLQNLRLMVDSTCPVTSVWCGVWGNADRGLGKPCWFETAEKGERPPVTEKNVRRTLMTGEARSSSLAIVYFALIDNHSCV
jgi:hypothetical protein